ncbi:DUF3558 domain-containing protein [Streptomyces sp. NBC_00872]|uniref:DUF3558 domain-containing protein n=1 Tax=Streptomyces sp. NBC_00872 TaxID=2903686 RepID=UPI00386E8C55|nr:DUF3558 domain-containing protein [Streptomyces sp. NBC_00872]
MQPKARHAYLPGLAALLVAVVAGCSGGGADGGSAADPKAGSPTTATAAAPGKYRTLREPCGAVPLSMLKDLLPGAASLPEDQQTKVYGGTAAVTYDTDRRVGCNWKADGADASHQLVIDLERVVSYDPAVSDDDRAQEVYTRKETSAALPSPSGTDTGTPPGTSGTSGTPGDSSPDTGSATGPATDPKAGGDPGNGTNPNTTTQTGASSPAAPSGGASGSPGTPVTPGSPSETPPAEGLEPRLLDGLGDAAFLNDVLARSGSAAQHRTVSVVFRTSNVIVTVRYTEQPALTASVPDSAELQDKARTLAKRLAEELDE